MSEPVLLSAYAADWPVRAAEEIARFRAFWPAGRVEHIGSTAVPGLTSKPILDIAFEVSRIADGERAIPALEALGYSHQHSTADHMFFVKGLSTGRTHHVHFFEPARYKLDREAFTDAKGIFIRSVLQAF